MRILGVSLQKIISTGTHRLPTKPLQKRRTAVTANKRKTGTTATGRAKYEGRPAQRTSTPVCCTFYYGLVQPTTEYGLVQPTTASYSLPRPRTVVQSNAVILQSTTVMAQYRAELKRINYHG